MTPLRKSARVAPVVVVKDHLANSKLGEQILRSMDKVGNAPHGVIRPDRCFLTVVFGGRLPFVVRLSPSG